MMKKILVAAVLVFTLCCCEQRKVAREMKAFMETEIRFTDDVPDRTSPELYRVV